MKTNLTKMIMSCVAVACAAVCLAAAMALGTSSPARAAADSRVCSVGMLRGLYLWTFDSHENVDGNFVPVAVMQGLRFNGDGDVQSIRHREYRGHDYFRRRGFSGTYTVNPDCTGTLSPAPGIAPSYNIYVGPGAQQVWTIQSAPDGSGPPE